MIINPVIEREFKTKMRNWRSPALIAIYLIIQCLIIFLIFKASDSSFSFDPSLFMPVIAVQSYAVLATIQLVLILLIIPAITSGAISGERERQTLDLMLSSNFSAYKIIWGKLVVSISQTLLLIVSASPFLCIVLLYGGIGLIDICKLFVFYFMTTLMVASFGIYFSIIFKKGMIATIATYLVLLIFIIVTLISFEFWKDSNTNFFSSLPTPVPFEPTPKDYNLFMFSNPFYGLNYLLPDSIIQGSLMNIFNMNFYNVRLFDAYNMSVYLRPFAINLYFDAFASITLYVLAVERLKPIKKSFMIYFKK